MTKRILVAIEINWNGACPEETWMHAVKEMIESDRGYNTHCRVVKMKKLTDFGLTEVLSEDILEEGLREMEVA